MPIYEYACDRGHVTPNLWREHMLVEGVWIKSEPHTNPIPCRICHATAAYRPSRPNVRMAAGRHYDVGAGKWFDSEADRDAYCKEHGLSQEPASHHAEYLAREQAEMRQRIEKEDAEFDAYQDALRNDPQHADFRRQIDSGEFHDKAVDRAMESLKSSGVSASREDIHIDTGVSL